MSETEKMRLNVVLPHQLPFPPRQGGGVENLNWLLVREFARRGHVVTAYSRQAEGVPLEEVDEYGVRHVRVRGYNRHPNRWVDHFFGLMYARHLAPALRAAEVSTFHTPFSFLFTRRGDVGACAHTLHRTPKWPLPFYRHLDRVYCGSDAVLAQARKVDGRIRNLKRIYNCIAVEGPEPEPRVPGKSLLFLYVGRFVPDKGLASLIEGFARSLGEFPQNRLKTVGPQTDEEGADARFFQKWDRYVRERGLKAAVEFLPPVFEKQRLNALIAEADVICVPSLTGETFSMAILEAMALAKPVLVSDFSPMPEAVDHLRTGYVARAGEAESLAEAIQWFSANSARIPELGRAGWRKARECFSVERIAGEYLEDFAELAQKRAARQRP